MLPENLEKQSKQVKLIHSEGSNPSFSSVNELIINKLEKLADKKPDKIEKLYKEPKIYNAGGDITKDWNVYYSYIDPCTGKFKRIPCAIGVNKHKNIADRMRACQNLSAAFSELLKEGFNPFDKYDTKSTDRSLSGCIRSYFFYLNSGSLSFNTTKQYVLQLTVFKKFCQLKSVDQLHLSKISKDHITDFKQYLKINRNITAGKTINNYINTLRAFFNYFMNNFDSIIEKSPAKNIKPEKQITRGNKAYTDGELLKLKEAILNKDPYIWKMFEVVYYAALRPEAEAVNLKIGDFDLTNNLIYVRGDISKGRENQVIPMYPEFKKILIDWNIQSYNKNYFLFGKGDKPGPDRMSSKNITKRFARIKTPLGFGKEYGVYSMKGTRACHLYDDGAEIRDIQLLFRHKTPLITMTYLRSLSRIERGRAFDKGREI